MSNKPQNNQASTIISTLTDLGLGHNEAVLYQILLDNPDASIPLLKQKSPFSRTMLYYVIGSLEQYGLVTTGKNGKKTTYNAEPPAKLEEFMQNQEKEIARQKGLLKDVIGDLTGAYRLAHHKPGVKFFEGKEGFKEALYDTLTANETIYTYVDADAVEKYAAEINSTYVKKREALGKDKKILALDTPRARALLGAQDPDHSTIRFLPKNMSPFRTGMQIYDGKIGYFTLREENIISVLVSDPDIYQMHRSLFEALWELQKPTV